MGCGHRQEQVGTLDLVTADAMREMVARDLIAIPALAQHMHGTRIDRMTPFLVGDAAGFHIHAIAKPALVEEVPQNDLSHRRTADVAGADGHYRIGVVGHIVPFQVDSLFLTGKKEVPQSNLQHPSIQ